MHSSILQVILPVGISFYTFQTLSYSIDIYRGNLEATRDLLAIGAFVSFFPHLVAGSKCHWGQWGTALLLFIYAILGGSLFMLALWRTSALNPVLALKRHLGLYETLGDIPKRHGCSYRNHFPREAFAISSFSSYSVVR